MKSQTRGARLTSRGGDAALDDGTRAGAETLRAGESAKILTSTPESEIFKGFRLWFYGNPFVPSAELLLQKDWPRRWIWGAPVLPLPTDGWNLKVARPTPAGPTVIAEPITLRERFLCSSSCVGVEPRALHASRGLRILHEGIPDEARA